VNGNRVTIDCSGKTKTQQHFREEANINTIMSRYKKTGILVDPVKAAHARKALYGDFTGIDFHAAQNVVAQGMQAFSQLPALIRKRFDNDAGKLIEFLQNPDNVDEAVRLGIVEKREVKPTEITPPKAEVKLAEVPKAQ